MNRLQLAQRLRSEAGVAGTGPTSTLNQTGELGRLVNWIDAAWEDIQSSHRWDFLWESATVTVVAATNVTAGSIASHRYVTNSTYTGTMPIPYLKWEEFRLAYPAALIADGTPIAWSIRPDKAFVVNAKPTTNTDYTVERYKNPIVLAVDGDIPALPEEHHMLIVWRALMMYAQYEEAGALYQTANANFDRKRQTLGMLESPDWSFGAALC